MQQDIHYEGKKLYINGKRIKFRYDVYDVKISGDVIIVLEDPPMNGINTPDILDNVYGFSKEGELLWRIEPPPAKLKAGVGMDRSAYVGMDIEDGKCIAVDFSSPLQYDYNNANSSINTSNPVALKYRPSSGAELTKLQKA